MANYEPNEQTKRAMAEIEQGKAERLDLREGENLSDALIRLAQSD